MCDQVTNGHTEPCFNFLHKFVLFFIYYRWLDEDSEDHLVERTLSLTQPEGEAWCMTLVTSESGGTDGPVQVEVFGESGGCKPLTVGENAEFASTQNFPVWVSSLVILFI